MKFTTKELVIISIFCFILGIMIYMILHPYLHRDNQTSNGSLEKIIRPIMQNTSIKDGDCLSYALYYKDYLDTTDYKLDVRKIDMAGVCPIGTSQCGEDEGMKHTYLIINGYGGECILDQKNLVCIQIRDEK